MHEEFHINRGDARWTCRGALASLSLFILLIERFQIVSPTMKMHPSIPRAEPGHFHDECDDAAPERNKTKEEHNEDSQATSDFPEVPSGVRT